MVLKGLKCQFDRACFKGKLEKRAKTLVEKQNMKKMEEERTERSQ